MSVYLNNHNIGHAKSSAKKSKGTGMPSYFIFLSFLYQFCARIKFLFNLSHLLTKTSPYMGTLDLFSDTSGVLNMFILST